MDVLEKLSAFYQSFEFEKGYIGQTEGGQLIPYFCVEKSEYPTLIATYAIHAREYVTTLLALKQIEDFVEKGKSGRVYFIPAINIDGIKIVLNGNPLYKANIRGVDLNVNFDARFSEGEKNVFSPSSENYVGEYPFSESESRALRDFTLKIMPDITLAYHSKGEEIYWNFYQNQSDSIRDKMLAESIAKVTGYKVKEIFGSCGGYKDWCIEKLSIPAFTIEVGDDNLSHPIGEENLGEIYFKNKLVIETLIDKYSEYKWNKNFSNTQ